MDYVYIFIFMIIILLFLIFYLSNRLVRREGIPLTFLIKNKKGTIFRENRLDLLGLYIDKFSVCGKWYQVDMRGRFISLKVKIESGLDFSIDRNGYISFVKDINYTFSCELDDNVLTLEALI